jgi:hypothetical protein
MKKFLLLLLGTLLINFASAQLTVNPQFGVNASRLTSDPAFANNPEGRVGYTIGLNLRIGDRVYLQPGGFWSQQGSRLVTTDDLGDIEFQDDLDINFIKVPVLLGYKLVDGYGFALRIGAGGVANFLVDVKDNPFGKTRDDFNDTTFGLRAGLGMDIFFLTLDVDYEYGISHYFTDGSEKQQMLSFALGIKF